jgi:hypothetical protein
VDFLSYDSSSTFKSRMVFFFSNRRFQSRQTLLITFFFTFKVSSIISSFSSVNLKKKNFNKFNCSFYEKVYLYMEYNILTYIINSFWSFQLNLQAICDKLYCEFKQENYWVVVKWINNQLWYIWDILLVKFYIITFKQI